MSFLDRFWRKSAPETTQAFVPVTLSGGVFSAWGGDAYSGDIYRGALEAIARNVSKLQGRHVVQAADGAVRQGDAHLNRLLQVRPNVLMNASDFASKMVNHLYLHSNAFAFIDRDGRKVSGFYPIDATSAQFVQDGAGALFVRFRTRAGGQFTFKYADVIHLRRFYNDDLALGTSNDAIASTLELADAMNQGMTNGIQTSATIRGILKFTSIMAPEKLAEARDEFMAEYLDVANSGGVVTVDQKSDYVPIDSKPYAIDADQMQQVKTRVYDYLGITEDVVSSSFSEDTWGAFFEGTIEPLALQMSLEYTSKVFNEREQAYGNSIIFDAGRMQYATTKTKAAAIAQLLPYGVLTLNQCLEMLNLPSVEGGDKRLQTLNVVDASRANEYQLDESEGE